MSYYLLSEMVDVRKRAPLGCEAMVGRRRCRREVIGSFGICSATRGYMLVCADHDVELNRAMLSALGLRNVGQRIAAYRRHRLPRIAETWRSSWISSAAKRKNTQVSEHE